MHMWAARMRMWGGTDAHAGRHGCAGGAARMHMWGGTDAHAGTLGVAWASSSSVGNFSFSNSTRESSKFQPG
eukprot:363593-Chlamydomonas_euryale.AAC.3